MKNETNISTQSNVNMMEIIEVVSEKARDSQLSVGKVRDLTGDLEALSAFLETSEKQALLFSAILTLNFRKKRVSVDALAGYLGMTGIKMLKYLPDLKVLQEKRWIRADSEGRHRNALVSDISYFVTRSVTDRIMCNLPQQQPEQFESIYQLLSALMQLSIDLDRGRISYFDMSDEAMEMVEANRGLNYVKILRQSGLTWQEELLFMLACQRTLTGDAETDLDKITGIACGSSYEAMGMKRALVNGTSKLVTSGYMKVEDGMFMNDKQVMVTDHALKTFFSEDAHLLVKADIHQGYLTRHAAIRTVRLFFDPKEHAHLQRLGKLLSRKGYAGVTERLNARNMRGGFTMLFHGAPGTGKTEAVMQLARRSRRDIMKVDLSQAKSMWFGESEKKIKEIFNRYAHVLKGSDHAPILFFNEADAIFGTRKELTETASMQTFNAMQNILLDEMERFDGILVATTNMTVNFDPAFERRFLYKIDFRPPSEAMRRKIWRSKLPEVPAKVIRRLAKEFPFAGGQIDNVARKYEIDSLLYDSAPAEEALLHYCREEKIDRGQRAAVGFRKNNDT